jgi:hypothetical protein
MRQDITAGRAFPDYVLPDHTKTERRLSALKGPIAADLARHFPQRLVDLSDPELERRWDAGDKSLFYPYGSKSMEQTLKEMAGAVDQYAGAA